MVEPGTVLLGKYRIEQVIGEGGMGVVARAHHLQLDQPVAIKFLLAEVLGNRDMVQRFVREAQAAVKLRSEHVARVLDVGALENGAPYMVMEFLDGMDLGGLLRQQGRLAPGLAVDLVLQACEALAEAHALGIVHRDVKPANFFITRRASGAPLLKVLDFGISKVPIAADAGMTSTQAILGTPAYMSPEQMKSSKHVDTRTDIWALGVVLYELLAGRRPFAGESPYATCLQIDSAPMPPLGVPLPPGLGDVVARCLEKAPASRFQDMAALAAALAPFAGTPTQAATSVERTAGVLGRIAAPPGTATIARARRVARAQATTLRVSAGEMAPTTRRVPRAGIVAAAAGATLSLAALVVVMGSGDGAGGPAPLAPGAEAPVSARIFPADTGAAHHDAGPAGMPAASSLAPDAGEGPAAEDPRAAAGTEADAGPAASEKSERAPAASTAASRRDDARRDDTQRESATRRGRRTRADERARRRKPPEDIFESRE